MPESAYREFGIPVRAVSFVATEPWRDAAGNLSLLVMMCQTDSPLFVAEVDLVSGHCRQVHTTLPRTSGGVALRAKDGTLYIASDSGHLLRFRVGDNALTDLGPLFTAPRQSPVLMAEAPDGAIYIGGHDQCTLTRYQSATGVMTQLGRMDELDHYFYPKVGADGTVAGLVQMCFPHVVLVDPATGQHRTIGPVAKRDAGEGSVLLHKLADGLLYLETHEGCFRLAHGELTPVPTLPPTPPGRQSVGGWAGTSVLPDHGLTWSWLDGRAALWRQLRLTDHRAPGGPRTWDLTLDWQGSGTGIYKLHLGPDRRLYGSSILPEHLFVATLDGSEVSDLGICSHSTGEAYSMGNLGGKLYISSYPHARLSVYDPSRPLRFGDDPEANPRDLGRLDQVANRPVAMVAGPAGKIWVGSAPDYGMYGGTLASYDPVSGERRSARHLTQDGSVVSLAWLPRQKLLLAGTTVWAGSGTQLRAYSGEFVLWDPERFEKVWAGTLGIDPIDGVYDLLARPDGTVVAVVFLSDSLTGEGATKSRPVHVEVLHLDPASRQLLTRTPLPPDWGRPLEWALQEGPGGQILAVTDKLVYHIAPAPGKITLTPWWRPADGARINVAGPVVDGTFYFATGPRLRAVPLPAFPPLG